MKILFATTNKAKIKFYTSQLKTAGIDIVTLDDLNIKDGINETGTTPLENAIQKATAYYAISHLPTIAIDEGLYLEGVPFDLQPGVHVRRVHNKRLNDQEMIAHYIHLVNQYGKDDLLHGYFKKAIAFIYNNDVQTFEMNVHRIFTNKTSTLQNPGYPLDSIQFDSALNKFNSEFTLEEKKKINEKEHLPIFDFLLQHIKNITL